jgi:anti-sigma regulatory factor (Ser/Thr protein kinase)
MALSEKSSASAPGIGAARLSELERLQATCRRQAVVIGTLRDAVSRFSAGAQALKAENAELRTEAARLRRDRRPPAGTQDRVEGAELAEEPIPIGPQAPGAARRVITRSLQDRVGAPVLANAALLVSELVTNSVRHSGAGDGADVVVRVHVWRDICRIEVQDPGCDGVIAPRPQGPIDGSGMGLHLVQILSERWGVVRATGGPTRVWAQLACGIGPS